MVQAVVAWYSAAIHQVQHTGGSEADKDLLQLRSARQAALEDLDRLDLGVGTAEEQQLTADYTRILRDLTARQ
ncbi:hypothetical protein ASC99_33340 [Kitasatospora sp. Root107]|nr:hypothetical protein ASC99_33340 [Kitasatospora sp. Root107]